MRYLFLVLLFVGCTKIPHNKINESSLVNYPELNTEVTANIGDHLVKKGLMVNETVLVVKKTVDKVTSGEYVQIGEDNEMFYFEPTKEMRKVGWVSVAIKKKDDGIVYLIDFASVKWKYKPVYEMKKRVSAQNNSFQQTLIFNGIVGNKLKIGYREFKDEMARPAFNNEVEYDLNTSKTIGYKGCKIEVIKADNESISYKVLKNFDD